MSVPDYLDDIDKAAQESYDRVSEDEQIVKSNKYGNGFSPETSESSESYEPKKLNARHREIIRLHALGYKGTEIAHTVGCTPQLVYMVVNSPMGEAFLAEIESARTDSVEDVRERLKEMSPLAAEVFLDIMNNGVKEHNRLKAAKTVLEMSGHRKNDSVNHNHIHLTKEDIDDIKKEHKGGPKVVEETEEAEVVEDFNETNHPEHNKQENA